MKPWFISLFVSCVLFVDTYSQDKQKDTFHFLSELDFDNIPIIAFDSIDSQKEKKKKEVEQKTQREKIFQYGIPIKTSIDIRKNGKSFINKNNQHVIQLGICCKTAYSINVIFEQFYLTKGSVLYITGANHKRNKTEFTHKNNSALNSIGTELIEDDTIFITLLETNSLIESSTIRIGKIIHGYREINPKLKRGLNNSGKCNYDVNCPQGSAYENARNSVVFILNDAGGLCTGTMMNTTSGPIKPYLLTAYHCGTDPSNWVFRFRWESDSTGTNCGQGIPSKDALKDKVIHNAMLKSLNKKTDFLLCELTKHPDSSWNVFYNGWDASGNIPKKGIGIHHPFGDIKKISLDFDTLCTDAFSLGENALHWRTNWDFGITEIGSSGSPLFNEKGQVIGQLQGGDSGCNALFLTDYYGKISESWEGDGVFDNRLKDWLDPTKTENKEIKGSYLIQSKKHDVALPFQGTNLRERFCEVEIKPFIIIQNNGEDTLKTVGLTYQFDQGKTIESNWNGQLFPSEVDTFYLPSQLFESGNHTFKAHITSNKIETTLANNTIESSFTIETETKQKLLSFQLDENGQETQWKLVDENGKAIYKGGPYYFNLEAPIIKVKFCLREGCYTFKIDDSGGDGLNANNLTPAQFTFTNESNDVFAQSNITDMKFNSSFSENICTIIKGNSDIQVSPNPTHLEYTQVISKNEMIESIQICSIEGKIIQTILGKGQKIEQIPISQLEQSIYLILVHTKTRTIQTRFLKL